MTMKSTYGVIDLAQVTVAVSSCCQSESTRISQEEAVASTQEFWSSFTTWSKLILAKQHFDHLVKVALWTWHLVSRKWLTPPPWDHPQRRRRSKPQTCKPRRRRSEGRWSPSCRRSSLWRRCQHGCTSQPALALPMKEQLDLVTRKYFKPVRWDQLTQKKPLDSKFGLKWKN